MVLESQIFLAVVVGNGVGANTPWVPWLDRNGVIIATFVSKDIWKD